MAGSDAEVMEIISRLCGGSSALEIISIFGKGGMGKTTLARNVYNHPLIVSHFEIRAWSTITSNFYRRRVVLDLLRCMNNLNSEMMSEIEFELIESLRKMLMGIRYLIVVDDIWYVEVFDMLKIMFPNNRNGSRIILTTRFTNVAKTGHHIHEMCFRDEEKTWNLFREKIYKGDPCPSRFEYMGKMIARSCRGHPLSVEVVSGILAADQTEAAWEDVLEKMKINVSDDDDGLIRILSLSYTYLPHHLRPCFLYLGIFPEDHDIYVSKLVKLWGAEGFLNESECKSYEEIGEECVEDLVRRSLVLVSKRKSNGGIKSIAIHDVMRDLCLRQAHIDNFILVHAGRFDSYYDRPALVMELQSCRRVSTYTCDDDFLEGVYGSTIRTIMLFLDDSQLGNSRWSLGNVGLLRILDLSNAYNYNLPEEVFGLFHLRFLAFHSGFSISEAISNLDNLQTLIIFPRKNDSGMFVKFGMLPEAIWRMPQLKHLHMYPFKFSGQKGETSALEDLQTLSGVVDFICSMENLKLISSLKKLSILYTGFRDVVLHYEVDNLIYLHKLEILKIEINRYSSPHRKMSCVFPPTLKKLSLRGLRLAWEDMNIVGLLPNLQVLKLRNSTCVGTIWETIEGGFSQLTYLMIERSSLEHWVIETSHFPRLKHLVLRQCPRLTDVQKNVGEIRTLELIEADYSNWSLLVSLKQIQEARQSRGNDPTLKVFASSKVPKDAGETYNYWSWSSMMETSLY